MRSQTILQRPARSIPAPPVIAAILFVGLCSCARQESSPPHKPSAGPEVARSPKPVRTEGIVRLNGVPLAGGMIMLLPEDEEHGRPASGMIEPDGSFELGTLAPGDGALPGKYRVVVTPQSASGKDAGKTKAVPERYTDPEKTPLRAVIESKSKDQTIRVDLLTAQKE